MSPPAGRSTLRGRRCRARGTWRPRRRRRRRRAGCSTTCGSGRRRGSPSASRTRSSSRRSSSGTAAATVPAPRAPRARLRARTHAAAKRGGAAARAPADLAGGLFGLVPGAGRAASRARRQRDGGSLGGFLFKERVGRPAATTASDATHEGARPKCSRPRAGPTLETFASEALPPERRCACLSFLRSRMKLRGGARANTPVKRPLRLVRPSDSSRTWLLLGHFAPLSGGRKK